MTSLTLAGLCWTLLAVWVVVLASEDEDIITPEAGQTVALPCRAPTGGSVQAVKWSRGDPGDQYVLLFRDGRSDPANQHPSFKERVELQDRQMKDGDASLILKDVNMNDDGEYQCEVLVGEPRSWETVSISYLSVHPPGSGELTKEGIIVIILGVALALAVVCLVFVMYKILKGHLRSNRARMQFSSVQATDTRPSPAVNTGS